MSDDARALAATIQDALDEQLCLGHDIHGTPPIRMFYGDHICRRRSEVVADAIIDAGWTCPDKDPR